jgi:hypothetical protein
VRSATGPSRITRRQATSSSIQSTLRRAFHPRPLATFADPGLCKGGLTCARRIDCYQLRPAAWIGARQLSHWAFLPDPIVEVSATLGTYRLRTR